MTQGWAVREDHDRADARRHGELLAAAREAFEELGYGATTIAEITRRAGVSRATFYVYFASKEQVFAVLAEQVRDRFLRAQDLSDLDRDDVDAVLRRTIETTLEATVENLALMTVLNHQAVADPELRALWSQIQGEAVHRTAIYVGQHRMAGQAVDEQLEVQGTVMLERIERTVIAAEDEFVVPVAVDITCARIGN